MKRTEVIAGVPALSERAKRIAERLQSVLHDEKAKGASVDELLEAARMHYAAMVVAQMPGMTAADVARLYTVLRQAERR